MFANFELFWMDPLIHFQHIQILDMWIMGGYLNVHKLTHDNNFNLKLEFYEVINSTDEWCNNIITSIQILS